MNRKQYFLMILLALVAGLIGGALSSQFFTIQTALAAKTIKPHEKIIRAGRFELVDEKGNIYATLRLSDSGPQLTMYDLKGSAVIELTADAVPFISLRQDNYNYARLSEMGLTIEESGYSLHLWANQFIMRGPNGEVEIASVRPGPHIYLEQYGRGKSTLGCIELVTKKTGTKITRSAASLVLFDGKYSSIWSTPE